MRCWAKRAVWALLCIAACQCRSEAQQYFFDRWAAMGPDYAGVYALEYDPFTPKTLVAGTFYGGMYRSTDAGLSWSHLESSFGSENVQCIVFDRNAPGTMYASTFLGGVYRTTDFGKSWVRRNQGLTNTDVRSVGLDPFDSNTLVAVTPAGNFISHDAGTQWQAIAGDFVAATAFFHPTQKGVLYLGLTAGGVARSTDGGATWTLFNKGIEGASILSFSFDKSERRLYAASFQGAFRLADGCDAWEDITYDLPPVTVHQVIHDSNPLRGERLLAATAAGLYEMRDEAPKSWQVIGYFPTRLVRVQPYEGVYYVATYEQGLLLSLNGTFDWKTANKGLQNLFIGSMASTRKGTNIAVYAGSDHGIYRVSQGSPSWTPSSDLFQTIFEITPHPTDSNIVFAGTERTGVWRSKDQGKTWQRTSKGMKSPEVAAIERSPLAPYTLWAGGLAGLYFSRDNGNFWVLATQVPLTSIRALATDPYRKGFVLAGTSEGQIYVTYDDGNIFLPVQGLPKEPVSQLKITSVNLYPVIAAVVGGKLYVSGDDARTWILMTAAITQKIYSAELDPTNPQVVYIATEDGLFKTIDGGNTWTRSNSGMAELYTLSLAIDPANPLTIFATTSGGIYRSTDAAETWQLIGDGLPAGPIDRVLCDPTAPGRLYVLIRGLGVYASTDGGNHWSERTLGLPSSETIALAVDPLQPGTIYAGTSLRGIFISNNAGVEWHTSDEGMGMLVHGIAIDPFDPSVMYAGSLYGGMFKSIDAGESWTSSGLTGTVIFKTVVDPAQPNVVYAATLLGVARSKDGGNKWTLLGQRSAFVNWMITDPRNRSIVYIGSQGNIFRSSNGGVLWESLNTGLPGGPVLDAAVDGTTGDIYTIVNRSLIYKRLDAKVWQLVYDFTWSQRKMVSITVDAASGTIWVATENAGILTSYDRGTTWSLKGFGLDGVNLAKVIQDPFSRNTLYGRSPDSGILKSEDGGETWQPSNDGLPTKSVYAIAADKNNSGVLFVATDQGFFKSSDRATTWTRAGDGLGSAVVSVLMVDEFDSNTLYAAGLSLGIYKSSNQGESWISIFAGLNSPDVTTLAQGPGPGIIFAGTLGSGFETTVDGGAHWSGGNLGEGQFMVQTLAVDPKNPSTLYAGSGYAGVIKSTDGGDTWKMMNKGLDNLEIFSMIIDPINTNTVYVGTYAGGVYVSDDGAVSWAHLTTEGLFTKFVTSLAIDPLDHNVVYAGTEGGGVFRFVRPPR